MSFVFSNTPMYALGNIYILYVLFIHLNENPKIKFNVVVTIYFVTFVLLASSILAAKGTDYSSVAIFKKIYGWLTLVGYYYSGYMLAKTGRLKGYMKIFLVASLLTLFVDIGAVGILNDTNYQGARENFLDREPSIAGLKIAFCIVYIISCREFRDSKHFLYLFLAIALLLLTSSKGAIISLGAFILVQGAVIDKRYLIPLLALAVIVEQSDYPIVRYFSYSFLGSGGEGSLQSRFALTASGIKTIFNNPLGIGMFYNLQIQDSLINSELTFNSELDSLATRSDGLFAISPKNVWVTGVIIFGAVPACIAMFIFLKKIVRAGRSVIPIMISVFVAGFMVDLSVEFSIILGSCHGMLNRAGGKRYG